MKAIEITNEQLSKEFSDDSLVIDANNLAQCKMQSKENCCRYLMRYKLSYMCAKHTSMKNVIDELVEKSAMVAKGDNCFGLKKK